MADGEITPDEYMQKLDHFIISRTERRQTSEQSVTAAGIYDAAAKYYKKPAASNRTSRKKRSSKRRQITSRKELTVKELYTLNGNDRKGYF